jgi:hypothetical protein
MAKNNKNKRITKQRLDSDKIIESPYHRKRKASSEFKSEYAHAKISTLTTLLSILSTQLILSSLDDDFKQKENIVFAFSIFSFSGMILAMYFTCRAYCLMDKEEPVRQPEHYDYPSFIRNPKAWKKSQRKKLKKAQSTANKTATIIKPKPFIKPETSPSSTTLLTNKPPTKNSSAENDSKHTATNRHNRIHIKATRKNKSSQLTAKQKQEQQIKQKIKYRQTLRSKQKLQLKTIRQKKVTALRKHRELLTKKNHAATILQHAAKQFLSHILLKKKIKRRQVISQGIAVNATEFILNQVMNTINKIAYKNYFHTLVNTGLPPYRPRYNHIYKQIKTFDFQQMTTSHRMYLQEKSARTIQQFIRTFHQQQRNALLIQTAFRTHRAQLQLRAQLKSIRTLQHVARLYLIKTNREKTHHAAVTLQCQARILIAKNKLHTKRQTRSFTTGLILSTIDQAMDQTVNLETDYFYQKKLWGQLNFFKKISIETVHLLRATLTLCQQNHYTCFLNGRMALYPEDTYNGLDVILLPQPNAKTLTPSTLSDRLFYLTTYEQDIPKKELFQRTNCSENKLFSQLIHTNIFELTTYITIRNHSTYQELAHRLLNHNRGLRPLLLDNQNVVRLGKRVTLFHENLQDIDQHHLTSNTLPHAPLKQNDLWHHIKDLSRCTSANQEHINHVMYSLFSAIDSHCTPPSRWNLFIHKALSHWKNHSIVCLQFLFKQQANPNLNFFINHLGHCIQFTLYRPEENQSHNNHLTPFRP